MLFPFHLILTSGPILIANNHQRVVLSWRMLSKVVFYVCVLLEFLQKKHGGPYYEPIIVVHNNKNKMAYITNLKKSTFIHSF